MQVVLSAFFILLLTAGARVALQKKHYEQIIVDEFSFDAIPTHGAPPKQQPPIHFLHWIPPSHGIALGSSVSYHDKTWQPLTFFELRSIDPKYGLLVVSKASYNARRSGVHEPKGDSAAIQGKWEVVAAVYNGEKRTNKDPLVWTITQSHVMYENEAQDAYKINPATKPKQIDITVVPAKVVGNVDRTVLLGIYELKGDSLRICIGHTEKDRPKDFKSGAGRNLFTLKRVISE